MMNSKLASWALAMAAAMSMTVAYAADDSIKTITKVLQDLVPNMTPDRIVESPIAGMYEVSFGTDVLYVSKDGRYALQGDLIDVASRENLSETRRGAGRLQLVNAVKEKDMIIFAAAPKQQKHVVTVFTDVDCTYCRKMHAEMADYNKAGITIRYLAFPRSGADTASYFKMVSVWCAKDRRTAMTRTKMGESIEQKTCDNPVKDQLALAMRLGVSGTPTLVLEDGSVVPGYMPAARLSQALDQAAAAK